MEQRGRSRVGGGVCRWRLKKFTDQCGLVVESTSGEIGEAVEFSDAPD